MASKLKRCPRHAKGVFTEKSLKQNRCFSLGKMSDIGCLSLGYAIE
jgi:hypothetical protein